jgi:hypothetical protein
MLELLVAGTFDDLPRTSHFAELSRSRMGWDADVELAQMLIDELRERDLARPSEDGVSIPLHPVVRQTILVILAQLARSAGRRYGLELHPTTDRGDAVEALAQMLALDPLPSAGHVIALDLQNVVVDLASVPLDDVLAFRTDHGEMYRAYMRRLREFLTRLAVITDPVERSRAVADRQEELADEARRLEKASHDALRRPLAGFALGIAGSAWGIALMDPIGAALAAAGVVIAGVPRSSETSAYSYLFSAARIGS